MSSNRVQYFIRNILQNSKLNREKFVKNKKKYNINNKAYSLISKRKISTYCNNNNMPPNNFNNNNWIIFASIFVTYIVTKKI